MKMLEDLKYVYEKRQEMNKIRRNLNSYRHSITRIYDDFAEYRKNLNKRTFLKSGADNKNTGSDYVVYLQNKPQHYIQEIGNTMRASACFYALRPDVDEECNINQCMNSYLPDDLMHQVCSSCPHYHELITYRSLQSQLQDAKTKHSTAKQKLLDNFRFWKTK